ncbi:MAG: phenylalanine--tRNA ligase subunit alpha [Candidatus Omnitrophica bacterium]|nr:phenylalanine--tRNA ligase subunit alpha [Candidatus Omnitrophota bacterium]
MPLSEIEQKVLEELFKEKKISTSALAKKLDLDTQTIFSITERLFSKGFLSIKEKISKKGWVFSKKGKEVATLGNLPEVLLLLKFKEKEKIPITNLTLDEKEFGLAFGIKNKWFKIENGLVLLTPEGVNALENKKYFSFPKEEDLNSLDESSLNFLKKRALIEQKNIVLESILCITLEGENYLKNSNLLKPQIKELDRQMLLGGTWRNGELVAYNLKLDVQPSLVARHHPIQLLKRKIKKIFLELGFREMKGNLVESSFWNFDALFQPQDHSARDLADTFYLDKDSELPSQELINKVKSVHEKKWGGVWSKEFASKTVLRTHTTAISARTLYNKKDKNPEKFFAIGKVFRNEATDYKHLAEFYQIEGIIVWQKANFSHLLGILKEFYFKLGFDKIRFRPSYFPYTEPSLEIEIFDKKKNSWLEIGGAGILRPEVCYPLCGIYPVLAWGLSLERPLMLAENLQDIRSIYKNELDWLRGFKYLY